MKHLPLQQHLLGGGISNYLNNPYFWGWANFDGEHYIFIAQNGYKPLTYFFFPVYPLLIEYIAKLFGDSLNLFALAGQFISNLSFLVALIGLWKLIKLDWGDNTKGPIVGGLTKTSTFLNCLFLNATKAIEIELAYCGVFYSTFHDMTTTCIEFDDTAASLIEYNNI